MTATPDKKNQEMLRSAVKNQNFAECWQKAFNNDRGDVVQEVIQLDQEKNYKDAIDLIIQHLDKTSIPSEQNRTVSLVAQTGMKYIYNLAARSFKKEKKPTIDFVKDFYNLLDKYGEYNDTIYQNYSWMKPKSDLKTYAKQMLKKLREHLTHIQGQDIDDIERSLGRTFSEHDEAVLKTTKGDKKATFKSLNDEESDRRLQTNKTVLYQKIAQFN